MSSREAIEARSMREKAPKEAIFVELEAPFHDLDPLFVVWHGWYYKYFEIARTALFLVGASPRAQVIAQTAGVLGGAVVGGAAYLILIPDPQHMLLTEEWPAPAVATWRAVAELFAHGADAMPAGTVEAMVIASFAGVVLAILEKVLPPKWRVWVPSPASLGLAFVIQAWTSISLFVGSLVGVALRRYAPVWSERYLTPIASGIIAGESLMGVAIALQTILSGGSGH